jgi:quinol monooxygenase YgiN
MKKKVNTEGTVLAFAAYKPKAGQEKAFLELVKRHLPVLRELQLATDRSNFIARSKDGTIIEVFEWTSVNAIDAAHQHPAVADIWEKMTLIADFIAMKALPEAKKPFSGFEILNVDQEL